MTQSSIDFIGDSKYGSIDSNVRELRDTNKERTPYSIKQLSYGFVYEMKDIFTELIFVVLDTDDMSDMSDREIKFWTEFLVYEEEGTGYQPELDETYYALDQLLMQWYNN